MTSAISTRLTWPKSKVSNTGSSSRAGGSAIEATETAPPGPPAGQTLRATTYSVPASATSDAVNRAIHAAVHGSASNGRSTIAANGG